MRRTSWVLATALLLAACGGAHQDALTGYWSGSLTGGNFAGIPFTLELEQEALTIVGELSCASRANPAVSYQVSGSVQGKHATLALSQGTCRVLGGFTIDGDELTGAWAVAAPCGCFAGQGSWGGRRLCDVKRAPLSGAG